MDQRNYFPVLLLAALTLNACIKTEIVPEVFEPDLQLMPASVTLKADETYQLTGIYTDEKGENRSDILQWSITDPVVATVNTSGLLTANTSGQAWAVATVPDGLADSILVTVVQDDNAVAKVVVTAPATTLDIGATLQLSAKAFNSDNEEVAGQTVTWSSSHPGVLSVGSDGTATALSAGAASITGSVSGVSSLPLNLQVIPAGGLSRTGTFSGNMGYSVSGSATLQPHGNSVRLFLGSNFQASNGPQLGVYLAKNASGGLSSQNSLKLADLAQNSGMQQYDAPAGIGLYDYDYVVIYCIPFSVRFGTAKLGN